MKRGVTTCVRPAHSGIWYPAYRTRETGHRHQDRYSAQRTSDRGRAGGERWLEGTRGAEDPGAESAETHAIDRAGCADGFDRGARELRAVPLELQDEPNVAVLEEHVGQCRHADPLTAERKATAITKEEPGVRAR